MLFPFTDLIIRIIPKNGSSLFAADSIFDKLEQKLQRKEKRKNKFADVISGNY